MGSAAVFAEILDDMLSGSGAARGVPDPPFQPRYIPPHPLLFAEPQRPFRPSLYRDVPRRETTTGRGAAAAPTFKGPRPVSRPVRPARPLTKRQRQALEAFIELGADLTPGFTAGELRSAYRKLALTYHPDRHSTSGAGEKARLTRILADLNEHHRQLTAAAQR
jgi:hypothetical protein